MSERGKHKAEYGGPCKPGELSGRDPKHGRKPMRSFIWGNKRIKCSSRKDFSLEAAWEIDCGNCLSQRLGGPL